MLGRGVSAVARGSNGAVDGGHVHDGALFRAGLKHLRDLVAHPVQHAAEVDADDLVPLAQVSLAGGGLLAADAVLPRLRGQRYAGRSVRQCAVPDQVSVKPPGIPEVSKNGCSSPHQL
ncbi:hypothetical protein D9M72_639160 [compost metagenome]